MASKDEIIRYVYEVTGSKELEAAVKTLLETGQSSETAAASVADLSDEFTNLAKQSDALKNFTKDKAALTEVSAQLILAKDGLAALNAQFNESDKSSKKISAAFSAAEKSVAALTIEESKLRVQFEKTEGTLAKAGIDSTNLAAAQKELGKRAGEAAAKIGELSKQSEQGGRFSRALQAATELGAKGFSKLRDGVNSLGTTLLKVTGLAGALGSALAALNVGRLFGGAISSATEFEAALSQVQAVSGATKDQLNRMRQAAEDASKTTTFSSLEAANALGELVRASGDADAAVSQLGPTLNLAQAAGIGASEAAAVLTTTLTQFGFAAEDAARVADLFAREANSTQDTVTDLGNAMSYAAPLARQLGVSFEETTAVLGAMADQGFRGERAGTALRNTFTALIDPSSAFRQELTALGIKSTNFTEVITELAAAGDKGKAALLALGDRAGPAISSLVTSGGAGIRRLTDDFRNAAGEAERTAKIMSENFSGASSRLMNAFDAMRRALVDPILEPLSRQFDSVAEKIRAFAETAQFERIKNAVKDFALGATDALIKFVGSVDFDAVSRGIENFATSAKEFFGSIKESAGTLGTALSVVGGTITTLFNGIQTIILGVAAASTAGLALMLKSAELTAEGVARLSGNYAQLKPIFDSVNEKIGGIAAVAEEFGRRTIENGKETAAAFGGLADTLSDTKASADGATASVDAIAAPLKLSAEQAQQLRMQFDALPKSVQAMVEPGLRAIGVFADISTTAPKAAAGIADSASALKKAESAAAQAYNELARLAGAGDSTSAAFRAAQAALAASNAEVARLKGVSLEAASAATALNEAQGRLGKTQAQLGLEAKQAASDLELTFASYATGGRAIEDVRSAFDRYAQALRASVANSDEWKKKSVEGILAVKAAALGISDIKGPDFKAGDTKPLTDGLQQVKTGSDEASQGLKDVSDQSGKTAEGVSSAAQAIQNIYAGFANELGKTSQAAIDQFTTLTRQIFELGSRIADFSGLARFGKAAQDAYDIVTQEVAKQKVGVAGLADQYANLSDDVIRSMARTRGGVDDVAAGFDLLAQNARSGTSEFTLLGQQDLSALAASAQQLAERVRQVGQAALDSRRAFADMAAAAQDEIDQINGNQDALELHRHERKLEQIKAEAEAAGTANSSEYNDAVDAENRLHNLKISNIRKQDEERRQSESASGSSGASSAPSTAKPSSGSSTGTGGFGGQPVTINWKGGQPINLAAQSSGDVQRLLDLLRQAANNSGGGGSLSG